MINITSFNLNGIRAFERKGGFDWLLAQNIDILCVQELKAQETDMTPVLKAHGAYHSYFSYAQRKGYSGVGIYAKKEAIFLQEGFGCAEFDDEGRYVEAHFKTIEGQRLRVISLYAPSGSAHDERQASKERFLKVFLPYLQTVIASAEAAGDAVVICGDWNIAHTESDLRNWRGNLKNSGFLAHERQWLSQVLEAGFSDVFRSLNPLDNPDNLHQYTWWSQRGQARANNVGWRIDYQFANQALAPMAYASKIDKEPKLSDHAALTLTYKLRLA